MLFTMPRFSILKTRTRSSVRNLGVEKVQYSKVEQDSLVVDVFQYPEDSLPSRDIEPVNIVNEFSENSKLTHKIEETDIVTISQVCCKNFYHLGRSGIYKVFQYSHL